LHSALLVLKRMAMNMTVPGRLLVLSRLIMSR